MSPTPDRPVVLSHARVLLLATATGLIVASNYYAQPLLQLLSEVFQVSATQVGWVVTVAQLAYATGLLLIVPLGDRVERRRLIVALFVLAALVVGVLALDVAVQAVHIDNQSTIYRLDEGARSRITAAYMTCYFIGGAAGSALGTQAWTRSGWTGVCTVGIALAVVALLATPRAPARR